MDRRRVRYRAVEGFFSILQQPSASGRAAVGRLRDTTDQENERTLARGVRTVDAAFFIVIS
ncbi:hypothetical protein [Reyranella sp.]|uniref:hypothetical protein n=1 Tax=Reyranella sp. TaxID=1929291 RepID=UPI003BA8F36C